MAGTTVSSARSARVRRWTTAAAACAAAAAFSAWEGTLGRYSSPAHASVLAVIAAALVTAAVAGHGRQRRRSADWARGVLRALADGAAAARRGSLAPRAAGALVWTAVAAATIGWDANSFARRSHALPTLSRLVGDVTDHQWGRALVFAAWLALGAYLAAGWRREPPVEGGGPAARADPPAQGGAP